VGVKWSLEIEVSVTGLGSNAPPDEVAFGGVGWQRLLGLLFL
jgi:hypothetical protein